MQKVGPRLGDSNKVKHLNRIPDVAVSGVKFVADPKHTDHLVNKTLADKDTTVSTPSEDSKESTISPVLCKAKEVKACRADAA